MQSNSTQGINEAIKVDEKKREAFLDQLASIIESSLFKNDLPDNKGNC
ncbi:hypothetical protein [Oceanobacillus bengalensis]|nr:hypothetical protein [Oceanobacillus bengalensis]